MNVLHNTLCYRIFYLSLIMTQYEISNLHVARKQPSHALRLKFCADHLPCTLFLPFQQQQLLNKPLTLDLARARTHLTAATIVSGIFLDVKNYFQIQKRLNPFRRVPNRKRISLMNLSCSAFAKLKVSDSSTLNKDLKDHLARSRLAWKMNISCSKKI